MFRHSPFYRVVPVGFALLVLGCASAAIPVTDRTFNDNTRYTYDIQDGHLQVTTVCRVAEPDYGMHPSGVLSSTDRCTRYARTIAEQIATTGALKVSVPYFQHWRENPEYSGFTTRDGGDTVVVIRLTTALKD